MKKILIAILLAAAAAPLAGYALIGFGTKGWEPGRPFPRDRVKVGVIHVSSLTEDTVSGYAYAHERGILEMQREIGLREDQIMRFFNVSDANAAATEYAMRKCVAEGANIIIATSWNHMEVCEKLAGEFPGVIFANATGVKRNARNFTNGNGRTYQARYLSGLVAGLRTATDRIGYVAAMGRENSEVTSGLNAFALGVESVNPGARIQVRTINRWYDPDGEALAARTLIESGCDVVAQHSNTAAPQIEAQKHGVWGIGYNSDMGAEAPGAVIASVIWNWGVYYKFLVKGVIDGSFTPTPYLGDIKNGMVDLTPINEDLAAPGTGAAVGAARREMLEGGFRVFRGAMATNEGGTVGRPGEYLSDDYIMNDMTWYYRNVTPIEEN